MKPVRVIGGGLAGCEAAWQIASRGIPVLLYEMRPESSTPAHRTDMLAELVCSNSLKSQRTDRASGLLKEELRLAGSMVIREAEASSIPGGSSLCVDRNEFSRRISDRIENSPNIIIVREEISNLDDGLPEIIATGPLTSESLSVSIQEILGMEALSFYDAIAPTIEADSINWDTVFIQNRYQKDEAGAYANCPLNEEQYNLLVESLKTGRGVIPHSFEDENYFEACMPVEVLANRGQKTLSFGPMRPVGLVDPANGNRPHAVVQLRPENIDGTLYSMVGFQTRLTHPEQQRVFRMIPGLENARFERLGSIHRNTFLNSPLVLDNFQKARSLVNTYFAGQITGVEGYVESISSGLMTGIYVSSQLLGHERTVPPVTTMTGAILNQLTISGSTQFQPVNAQFGLLPPLPDKKLRKDRKRQLFAERALDHMAAYLSNIPSGH